MAVAVVGDLYNRLFVRQASNPEITVDYEIWTQMNDRLPQRYVLPDTTLLSGLLSGSAPQ